MNSVSTTQEIQIEEIEIDETDLVPITTTRIHKMFQNTLHNKIKKKTFIDLTQDDIPQKKIKKQNSQTKKSDPFEKLGKEVFDKVNRLVKQYQIKYKPITKANSLEDYNQNVIQFFVKYLLFGLQEMNSNKPQNILLNLQQKNIIQTIYSLSKSIQRACFKAYGNNLKAYQARCKLLVQNMKDITNSELRCRILQKTISPQQLSIIPQNQLQSSQRKLAQLSKVKYLLAEANVVITQENNQEQIKQINMIQQKTQIQIYKPIKKSTHILDSKFLELERLMVNIPKGIKDRIKVDLTEQYCMRFETQLLELGL